jgi:hypothetical protein
MKLYGIRQPQAMRYSHIFRYFSVLKNSRRNCICFSFPAGINANLTIAAGIAEIWVTF